MLRGTALLLLVLTAAACVAESSTPSRGNLGDHSGDGTEEPPRDASAKDADGASDAGSSDEPDEPPADASSDAGGG